MKFVNDTDLTEKINLKLRQTQEIKAQTENDKEEKKDGRD